MINILARLQVTALLEMALVEFAVIQFTWSLMMNMAASQN
jgi:hypothetical protein